MIFAVTNQKGGVGKTTDTINVSGALAALGDDVLAVDADPQGYFTNRLGFAEAYKADGATLYEAMKEPRSYTADELVVEHEEFDVLPSNIDMFQLEQDLIAAGRRPRQRLSTLFDQDGFERYDHVVIDAPPSLGPINDNVVLAAQNVLVPVEADEMMQLSINHLLDQIESLESHYDVDVAMVGVVISNIDRPLDNEQKAMIEWFEDTFEGRCPVYEVYNRVAITRSIQAQGSVFGAEGEESDMNEMFREIAEEVRAHD